MGQGNRKGEEVGERERGVGSLHCVHVQGPGRELEAQGAMMGAGKGKATRVGKARALEQTQQQGEPAALPADPAMSCWWSEGGCHVVSGQGSLTGQEHCQGRSCLE